MLGVLCVMMGFAYDLTLCFRSGAIGTTAIAVVLYYRGLAALSRNYKDTEVWIMLEDKLRPSTAKAQEMIGAALREIYLRFSFACAVGALALWSVTFFAELEQVI